MPNQFIRVLYRLLPRFNRSRFKCAGEIRGEGVDLFLSEVLSDRLLGLSSLSVHTVYLCHITVSSFSAPGV